MRTSRWIAVVGALAGSIVLLVSAATSGAASPTTTSLASAPRALFAPSDWLAEINHVRVALGLRPVTEDPAWSQGLVDHFRYLADTPTSLRTGPYQSVHTENPASPFYTAEGAQEAGASDLYEGAVGFTPVQFIDGWLAAPLHAIGLLRPGLQQVAFAYDPVTGDAGLDVISGLTGSPTTVGPVTFPGPGAVTDLTSYTGELPDPTESCPSRWSSSAGVDLPLIALLPATPETGLTATLQGPTSVQTSGAGDLCVVDQFDYVSSDPVYGPTGLDILQGDHAVLLFPSGPLVAGTYDVSIDQPGSAPVHWTFVEDPPLVEPIVGMAPTPDRGGYWLSDAQGGVSPHGDAAFFGSMAGRPLVAPITHIVPTADGQGYWLVASDGGVFAFGDALFFGSMGGVPLNPRWSGSPRMPPPGATGFWPPTGASSPSARRSWDRADGRVDSSSGEFCDRGNPHGMCTWRRGRSLSEARDPEWSPTHLS